MIVFDDLDPSEKIKVYDKGITVNDNDSESVYQKMIGYRTGDMWSPKLDVTEALRTEGMHFLQCIRTGERPISDGEAGLRIVKILEAANQSMKKKGQLVELNLAEVSLCSNSKTSLIKCSCLINSCCIFSLRFHNN